MRATLPMRRPMRVLHLLLILALLLSPGSSLARPMPDASALPDAQTPARAPAQAAPGISATKSDTLLVDQDNDGRADTGDSLRYTIGVTNSGAIDATGVTVADLLDPNTSLVPGSLRVSPLAFPDAYPGLRDIPLSVAAPGVLANDTGSPAPAATAFSGPTSAGGSVTVTANGGFSYTPPAGYVGTDSFSYTASNAIDSDSATVTITIAQGALATDDGYAVTNGGNVNANVLTNDSGAAALTALSFGDSLANVGAVPADGVTALSIPAGTGAIDITIDANGAIGITSVGTTGSGALTLFYRMRANDTTTDTAQVTINYGDSPVAVDDTNATLGAAAYTTAINTPLTIPAGSGLLNNDLLGNPAATLTFFGGGDASPTVDQPAGTTRNLGGGGALTVNADGSLSFTPVSGVTGIFTFQYRIANGIGTSTAVAEILVTQAPAAVSDGAYTMGTGTTLTITTADPDDLLENDMLGTPAATLTSFGGGSLGGAVTDNVAGATVALAGGNLTVNADGSFSFANPTTPGAYTFQYRLTNIAGTSDATVTFQIQQSPVAEDDDFTMLVTATLNGDLTVDNGNGADNPGSPAYNALAFGGGDLGGTVTSNNAGASAALAGGTLTVNLDGSFSLANPTIPGVYTFQYRLSSTIPASDDATVTIEVRQAPIAQNDTNLIATVGLTTNLAAGTLFSDNGSGADTLGTPAATLVNFGGGNITGSTLVTDFAAGATTGAGTFAGGRLTVNLDGSVSIINPTINGTFTFVYRIQNAAGFDDATVTITIQEAPTAQPDTFAFLYTANQNTPNSLFISNGSGPDTLGNPNATIASFGGGSLGGAVADNTAGSSVTLAGGTLTVNANGSWTLTGQPFTPGSYTFDYQLDNGVGASAATVTLNIQQNVAAVDDGPYTVVNGLTLTVATGDPNDLLDNDTLGFPAGTIINFGGGSLGGTVTSNAAGATLTPITGFSDGALTVNADGSFSFTPPTAATRFCGDFTFEYRLDNGISFDDGLVTITVQCVPVAQPDTFTSGFVSNAGGLSLTGDLNNNNGGGADDLGNPTATLTSFGGGSLGGTVTDNAPGASVAFAGGTITVNADGTFTLADVDTAGTFTFQYRLTNAIDSDDATVTFTIDAPPTVNATTPANGAVNILPSSNIVITFSENVAVAGGGISVDCGAGAVAGATSGSGTANVTFNPTANLPGNATCTVTVASANVTDSDASDPPNNLDGNADGIEGGDYVFSFQVAPEALDDSYTVTPHLTFSSALAGLSVRNNDNPADSIAITGFGATLATANGTIANGTNSITAGGAGGRVILNADGSFSFYPDAADDAPQTATFFYTITGGDTAQVTLSFEAEELVWFVDSTPGTTVCTGTNVGTQACPAAQLTTIAGIDEAGNTIFIASGNYTAGITLEANEILVGDGSSSNLQAISGVSPVVGSNFAPYAAFSGTDPVLTTSTSGVDAITVATNTTIRGLTIADVGAGGDADDISGSAFGTLTVTEVTLSGTGRALDLTNGTLAATFDSVSSSTGANNISLATIAGTLTINAGSMSGASGAAFSIIGGTLNATYRGSITQANNAALVSVSGGHASGTVTFQTGTLSATNGSGIQFDNADGTYNFAGTTTLSGGDAGIDILNGSSGAVTFGTGASITNPSGTGFNLSGSNANVTYSGSISDNSGFAVDIDNHDSGTVTFQTGAMSSTGQGLRVQNSNGGTVNFANPTKTLNTGASQAVTLDTNNGGGTVNFTGGGLDIDTTSATGFSATGGGTVTVQGTGNTIASTTGTALNIANTTIGASGVTFQSIASNGGSNTGIILNTTGSAGGLTITGTGSAGTGGTIANKSGTDGSTATGVGISLNNTANVSLSWMQLNDHANYAIYGVGVNGFTLANSVVNGVNGTYIAGQTPDNREGGVFLRSLSGTALLNANTIRGSAGDNINIINTSGTLTSLTISNNTIRDNSNATTNCPPSCGEDGLWLEARTAAAMPSVSIANNQFLFHRGDHIDARADGTSSLTISITGNTMQGDGGVTRGGTSLGSGILVLSGGSNSSLGSATINYNISNNTLTGSVVTALAISQSAFTSSSALISGTIANNSIGTAGILDSGSAQGSDISVDGGGLGRMIVAITNNTVRQYNNHGILLATGDGSAPLTATVTGNTVANPGTFAFNGIHLNHGKTSTPAAGGGPDSQVGCIDIRTNSITGSGAGGGTDFRLRQRINTTVQLPGYTGANNNDAAVVAFVQVNNPTSPSGSASNTVGSGGGGFTNTPGGAPCTQPAPVSLTSAGPTLARVALTNSTPTVDETIAPQQAAGFPLTIGTLPAGKRVRIVFDVQIDDPLPPTATQVANQATISGANFTAVLSDDPTTPTPADPTITPLGQFAALLPLVVREGYPDLVVDSISTAGGTLQIVIRNLGPAAVVEPFWVDLYVNPSRPPTAVNQIWQTQGNRGATWGIAGAILPILPGETRTLSIGDTSYRPDLSDLPATIGSGTPLYAQVDSANTRTTYGGVLETHEQTGAGYNNILGPVAAASLRAPAPSSARPPFSAPLPTRP